MFNNMKINTTTLTREQLLCFYIEFRKLYGNFFSDSEINHIIDNNDFTLVTIIPPSNYLQEVDLLSLNPDFGVAKENGEKFLRFEIIKSPIQNGQNQIKYVISGFRALTNIDKRDLLEETFSFGVITYNTNNEDLKLINKISRITNKAKYFSIIVTFLKRLIEINDIRTSRAKEILDFYNIDY